MAEKPRRECSRKENGYYMRLNEGKDTKNEDDNLEDLVFDSDDENVYEVERLVERRVRKVLTQSLKTPS